MAARYALTLWILLAWLAAPASPAAEQEAFVLVREDGSRIEGKAIADWHQAGKQPRLDGTRLLEGKPRPRLLWRTDSEVRRKYPYLRMRNGDILRGRPVGFEASSESLWPDGLLHVGSIGPTGTAAGQVTRNTALRVRPDWVEEIVQGPSPATLEPNSVVLRDGRTIRADLLRWSPQGLLVLRGADVQVIDFPSLYAARFASDGDDLAKVLAAAWAPGRSDQGCLVRSGLTDGTLITGWSSEFRFRDRQKMDDKTIYIVQPDWSVEGVPMRIGDIATWVFRDRDEIPLSMLPWKVKSRTSMVGLTAPPRVDESIRQAGLRCADLAAPAGFGMAAGTVVSVDLPEGANGLSGWVGISHAIEEGGCARAWVSRPDRDKPLWTSGFLRGGQGCQRFGPLDLKGAKALDLTVDPAHTDRPAGADPFDIRDEVDWLLPILRVPAPKPMTLVEQFRAAYPFLADWTIVGKPTLELSRAYVREVGGQYPALRTDRKGVVLRRTVDVTPQTQVLTCHVEPIGRYRSKGRAVLRLTAGKTLVHTIGDAEEARLNPWASGMDVVAFDLSDLVGQTVELTLQIRQEADRIEPGHIALGLLHAGFGPRPVSLDAAIAASEVDKDSKSELIRVWEHAWVATSKPGAWIQYDLGSPHRIRKITLDEHGGGVQRYELQVRDSEDEPWRAVHEGERLGRLRWVPTTPPTGRYVRLEVIEAGGRDIGVRRFQVFGDPVASPSKPPAQP